MADETSVKILLEEYKALWTYYMCQINILSGFRELYIKVFLIPVSILSAVAVPLLNVLSNATKIHPAVIVGSLAILAGICLTMGIALFTSYYKELGNLGNYEAAMIDIRQHLWRENKLDVVRTIDGYRRAAQIGQLAVRDERSAFYRSLLFSLGAIFIVGNSALLALTGYAIASAWLSMTTYHAILFSLGLGVAAFILFRQWSYQLYKYYTGGGATELSSPVPSGPSR